MTRMYTNRKIKIKEMIEGKAYLINVSEHGYADDCMVKREGDSIIISNHFWKDDPGYEDHNHVQIHKDALVASKFADPPTFELLSLDFFYDLIYLDLYDKWASGELDSLSINNKMVVTVKGEVV